MFLIKSKYILLILACVVIYGCSRPGSRSIEPRADEEAHRDKSGVAGNFSSQQELTFDSAEVKIFLDRYPEFSGYEEDLGKFYRSRRFAYAWYDQQGLIEQAGSLFNRIRHINLDGITVPLPYADVFTAMMDDRDSLLRKEPRNASAELMLTAQYFSFARHVWEGVEQTDTDHLDWYLARKRLNLEALMDSLLLHPLRSINSHEPVYRQYALLKSYLKRYREIDSAGSWIPVRLAEKRLSVGDSSDVIAQVRRRLASTLEFEGDTSLHLYTVDLEEAIKKFQESRGLHTDGIIGPSVIGELNIRPSAIIEKIVLNMERARWVPVKMEGDYIVVNIPAFKLYVYDHDSLMWDMNIVAGQPIHETVIFNGDLKYVVFSPYWNVPQSIYRNEILPAIQRDPDYLDKHNMEKFGNSVRQKPGPNNSLGRVKFLFPNSYNIYLHDTPAKSLFSKDSRAFSHGCIRLAEPRKLALYLLRDSKQWTPEKIDAAMKANKEKWVTLDKPVPVFIAYFTAWVGRDGRLNLRKDVYNRDARLAGMMINN